MRKITLAKDASNDDLEKAKQHVKDQGGEIVSLPLSTSLCTVTDMSRSTSSP
jgi:hypothetical protein